MDVKKINKKIHEVRGKYYKLILLLSPFPDSNTKALKEAGNTLKYPYINFSLVLAGKLMDIPANKRRSQVINFLPDIAKAHPEDVLLLDHIEILFLPELEVDPLRVLQQLSRNKTIVAAWTGEFDGKRLVYAGYGHPEYKQYRALTDEDFDFVSV